FRVIHLRNVIGGVLLGMHQLGTCVQQKRSLNLAGVKSIRSLLRTDALNRRTRGTKERESAQSKLGAQIASHYVYERSVASMGVVYDDLLESAGRDARTKITHDREKRLRAYRKRTRKPHMLIALAIADGRQRVHR